MGSNPNAVVGTGSGLSGGILLVYVLSLFGVNIDAYVAVAITAAVTGAVLWIGRVGGIEGLWQRILHGNPPPVPPA
jgi:hypothetical protein